MMIDERLQKQRLVIWAALIFAHYTTLVASQNLANKRDWTIITLRRYFLAKRIQVRFRIILARMSQKTERESVLTFENQMKLHHHKKIVSMLNFGFGNNVSKDCFERRAKRCVARTMVRLGIAKQLQEKLKTYSDLILKVQAKFRILKERKQENVDTLLDFWDVICRRCYYLNAQGFIDRFSTTNAEVQTLEQFQYQTQLRQQIQTCVNSYEELLRFVRKYRHVSDETRIENDKLMLALRRMKAETKEQHDSLMSDILKFSKEEIPVDYIFDMPYEWMRRLDAGTFYIFGGIEAMYIEKAQTVLDFLNFIRQQQQLAFSEAQPARRSSKSVSKTRRQVVNDLGQQLLKEKRKVMFNKTSKEFKVKDPGVTIVQAAWVSPTSKSKEIALVNREEIEELQSTFGDSASFSRSRGCRET